MKGVRRKREVREKKGRKKKKKMIEDDYIMDGGGTRAPYEPMPRKSLAAAAESIEDSPVGREPTTEEDDEGNMLKSTKVCN